MKESIEIWMDIPGYEKMYQVSSMGNVKSLKRKNPAANKKAGKEK